MTFWRYGPKIPKGTIASYSSLYVCCSRLFLCDPPVIGILRYSLVIF